MSDLTTYQPPATDLAATDPTGGRLIAWAEAASAANSLARALSQTAFVPKEMTNVGNATAAILMGDELGLSPLAALRSIYVVHGTPALYARSMVALALAHGHQIWTEETSDAKVIVCGQRRGSDKTERAEWTISRAQKAGYTSNKKYASTPQEMLYSKAAAEVARKVAPDVLAGIPYSVEDLELEDVPTTTVTRESAAKRTVARRKKPEPKPDPAPEPPPATTPEPVDATDWVEVPDAPQPDEAARDEGQRVRGRMYALLSERGITDADQQRAGMSAILGREITSRAELTVDDMRAVIADLEGRAS